MDIIYRDFLVEKEIKKMKVFFLNIEIMSVPGWLKLPMPC